MVARRRRLARIDFPALIGRGKRATTEHFSIAYTNTIHGHAVVVSKKVVKTAVKRHQLKRRVGAILSKHPTPSGCVVFARTGVGTLSFNEIKEELGTLLARLAT